MDQLQYFCPGESHPIAASVHFARLQAGFLPCRNCPGNQSLGAFEFVKPLVTVASEKKCVASQKQETTHVEIFRSDEISRLNQHVLQLSHWFWTQQAFTPVKRHTLSRQLITRPQPPTILIGYDGDYATGARLSSISDELNLQGVKLIDAGKQPLACLEFLRISLEVDGYLHLSQIEAKQHTTKLTALSKTGTKPLQDNRDGPPCVTGKPDSEVHPSTKIIGKTIRTQNDLTAENMVIREVRNSGTYRTHAGLESYESNLLRRLHGMRPLKICLSISNPYHHVLLNLLQEEWPLRAFFPEQHSPANTLPEEPIPHGQVPRNIARNIVQSLHQHHLDLGCYISNDGLSCHLWDEKGELLDQSRMFEFLTSFLLHEFPDDQFLIGDSHIDIAKRLNVFGERIQTYKKFEEIFKKTEARMIFTHDQHIWHKDPEPRRDGFLTLIYTLKKMSQQDTPLSTLAHLRII